MRAGPYPPCEVGNGGRPQRGLTLWDRCCSGAETPRNTQLSETEWAYESRWWP